MNGSSARATASWCYSPREPRVQAGHREPLRQRGVDAGEKHTWDARTRFDVATWCPMPGATSAREGRRCRPRIGSMPRSSSAARCGEEARRSASPPRAISIEPHARLHPDGETNYAAIIDRVIPPTRAARRSNAALSFDSTMRSNVSWQPSTSSLRAKPRMGGAAAFGTAIVFHTLQRDGAKHEEGVPGVPEFCGSATAVGIAPGGTNPGTSSTRANVCRASWTALPGQQACSPSPGYDLGALSMARPCREFGAADGGPTSPLGSI